MRDLRLKSIRCSANRDLLSRAAVMMMLPWKSGNELKNELKNESIMKKIVRIAFAISLISGLFACNEENEPVEKTTDLVFSSEAADPESDQTRTALDLDGYTAGASTIGFLWKADDFIVVYDGTNAVQSSKTELLDGGKRANFTVSGLNTAAGTQYKIFYGAHLARFDKKNNHMLVNVVPRQTQSEADNSEHLHTGTYTGDCGWAEAVSTGTAGNLSFSLKHLSCYLMASLTKDASDTRTIRVTNVKMSCPNGYWISAADGTCGVRIDGATGKLMNRDGGGTYIMGFGRYATVDVTIENPIELSATPQYAFAVFAPLDDLNGTKNVNFTVTYTVDGGAEQTKLVKTIKPTAFVSGKVYRVGLKIE